MLSSSHGQGPHVVQWTDKTPPSEQEAEARLSREGYESFIWRDVAGATYPRHKHDYDECLWLIQGSIVFTIDGTDYALAPGDRLYLPKSTAHSSRVPSTGTAVYLVGQRKRS